jgi:5-methylcytosine-specific restriction endonuclease McrA
MDSKLCRGCSASKKLTEFNRHPLGLLGRQARCKECERTRQVADRKNDPERFRQYDKKRRLTDPRVKARDDARRLTTEWKAAARERGRRWYQRNREKTIARAADWIAANPLKDAAHRSNVRAQRRGAPGDGLRWGDWPTIVETFNRCCAYCLKHESSCGKLQQDHVIPIVRGGAHEATNIVPACAKCNRRKSANPIWEMLRTA